MQKSGGAWQQVRQIDVLGKKMGLVFVVKRNFPNENNANLIAAQEIIPFPEMLADHIFLNNIEKIKKHPFIRREKSS